MSQKDNAQTSMAKKNIVRKSSKTTPKPDDLEGLEETEITANISLPQDGKWGWVVVFCSFFNIFILDGVTYTFGSLLHDVSLDLKVSDSLVAFINSIAVALYFIASPLASALINRFGFRECAMTGSVICSFSLLTSYFTTTFATLCIFYGAIAGFGYSLINLSSGLIVGFYFEKLRSLALSIATCGSSIGVMTLFPTNTQLVKMGGWRTTTLFHSGLFGLIYFMSMSFRPLLSVTVVKTEDERTVTYLPTVIGSTTASTTSGLMSTATERLFRAVSNVNYPTAAEVIESPSDTTPQPGPSTAAPYAASKLTLVANEPPGGISRQQIKQMESIISRTSQISERPLQIIVLPVKSNKRSWWARCWHWDHHPHQSRPMYRDDVFYQGKLEDLPEYQKSILDERKTGFGYQLAVSRVIAKIDLQQKRGIFTVAIRRVLATMMDPKLLKRCSFLLLCASGFLTYLGFLVPYVYLQDRNLKAGVDPKHCNLFVSAIGFSNACGRLVLGLLASKFDPLKMFSISCLIAGISTILSGVSFNLYYQYTYCAIFGFTISSVASLRSVILVSLYGLDKLTNATGMMLIFVGFGNLISTPVAGLIKTKLGYSVAFYVAGTFIALSGLILIPVKPLSNRESKRQFR